MTDYCLLESIDNQIELDTREFEKEFVPCIECSTETHHDKLIKGLCPACRCQICGGIMKEVGPKPFGLWFSVEGNDDGWKWWCEAESFHIDRLAHETHLEITPDANILHLRNAPDIERFHNKYASALSTHLDSNYIDWRLVAKDYQGIIISPYVWACRMDGVASRWYYGWDCASGCVWDKKAIRIIEPATLTEIDKAFRGNK